MRRLGPTPFMMLAMAIVILLEGTGPLRGRIEHNWLGSLIVILGYLVIRGPMLKAKYLSSFDPPKGKTTKELSRPVRLGLVTVGSAWLLFAATDLIWGYIPNGTTLGFASFLGFPFGVMLWWFGIYDPISGMPNCRKLKRQPLTNADK